MKLKTSSAVSVLEGMCDLDTLRIYDGEEPESADDPATGKVLCEIVGCQIKMSPTARAWVCVHSPWVGIVKAEGIATYFRFASSGDDSQHVHGSILVFGESWKNAHLAPGDEVRINNFGVKSIGFA